jgi:molybdenum cofactor synthesis domain-containing protein
MKEDPLREVRQRITAATSPRPAPPSTSPRPAKRGEGGRRPGEGRLPTRVTHLVHGWPPYQHAGTELYAYWLVQQQLQWRDVSVFTRMANSSRKQGEAVELNDHGARVRLVTNNFVQRDPFARNAMRDATFERSFERFLREEQPELLHIHHLAGHAFSLARVARRLGIPVVQQIQDWWSLCGRVNLFDFQWQRCSGPALGKCARCAPLTGIAPAPLWNRALHLARRAAARTSLAAADAYVMGSQFIHDDYARAGLLAKGREVFVLPYGVQASRLRPRGVPPRGTPETDSPGEFRRAGRPAVAGETPALRTIRISQTLPPGTNIRKRGEDMRAGDTVLRAGSVIRAGEIGVLAGVQKTHVSVGRRPAIAILSTGDELVEIDQPRPFGKIVNSNSWSIEALVREAGAIPRRMGIVRDTREATIAAIESALDCDFILTSGGVSVGAWDFVKDALEALGAESKFWRVAMKPGKPVVLSTLRGRLVFGLPGNPVSCMVSFQLFVAPAIRKAMGQTSGILPPIVRMPLAAPMTSKGDRRTYMRVRVAAEGGALAAHPMRAQGSGVSTSMLGANGFAVMAEGVTRLKAGGLVDVVLFGPIS